jgi:hypothetical protein
MFTVVGNPFLDSVAGSSSVGHEEVGEESWRVSDSCSFFSLSSS